MVKPRTAREKHPESLALRTVQSIVDEIDRMHAAITSRAYEIFNGRGGADGHDMEDWLLAERELTWAPAIELTEKDGALRLEAAVAGFEPDDLDVRMTPREVLIQSDRMHQDPEEEVNTYRCDFRRGKLFCSVQLPQPVDPEKAAAEYRNGLLTVTAPIAEEAAPGKRVKISAS